MWFFTIQLFWFWWAFTCKGIFKQNHISKVTYVWTRSRCFVTPPPSFETVYCSIFGRWTVDAAWYRMICLVLVLSFAYHPSYMFACDFRRNFARSEFNFEHYLLKGIYSCALSKTFAVKYVYFGAFLVHVLVYCPQR